MTKILAPKRPNQRCWEVLKENDKKMELEEFERRWDVTRQELAQICRCSLPVVHHWYTKGKSHVPPSEEHKRRLAMAHYSWSLCECEPDELTKLRSLYEQRNRRKNNE